MKSFIFNNAFLFHSVTTCWRIYNFWKHLPALGFTFLPLGFTIMKPNNLRVMMYAYNTPQFLIFFLGNFNCSSQFAFPELK